MLTSPDDSDRRSLDRAATLLDLVGRVAQGGRGGGVAIHCLLAADLLAHAGADPDLPAVGAVGLGSDVSQRLLTATALRLLGDLSQTVLDDDRVLDAIQHALLAHAATA